MSNQYSSMPSSLEDALRLYRTASASSDTTADSSLHTHDFGSDLSTILGSPWDDDVEMFDAPSNYHYPPLLSPKSQALLQPTQMFGRATTTPTTQKQQPAFQCWDDESVASEADFADTLLNDTARIAVAGGLSAATAAGLRQQQQQRSYPTTTTSSSSSSQFMGKPDVFDAYYPYSAPPAAYAPTASPLSTLPPLSVSLPLPSSIDASGLPTPVDLPPIAGVGPDLLADLSNDGLLPADGTTIEPPLLTDSVQQQPQAMPTVEEEDQDNEEEEEEEHEHDDEEEEEEANPAPVAAPTAAVAPTVTAPTPKARRGRRKGTASKKRFQCSYCSRYFVSNSVLIRHVRVHTGEKPFICSHCGTGFKQMGTLTSHIRIHTGETPFTCETCNMKFRHRGSLNRHCKRVHK